MMYQSGVLIESISSYVGTSASAAAVRKLGGSKGRSGGAKVGGKLGPPIVGRLVGGIIGKKAGQKATEELKLEEAADKVGKFISANRKQST